MKVEFIDRHKDEHGVQPICDALAETSAAIAAAPPNTKRQSNNDPR